MAFEIRRARQDDVEPLVAVLESALAEEVSYLATELPIDREARIARWRWLIDDVDSAMFVLCKDDAPTGQIALSPHPEYGLILGMLVARPYRGRGAGGALLAAGIDWAASRGASQLSLLVFATNKTAISLYEKFGFLAVDYYPADVVRRNGEAWDTILMRRDMRQS